MGLVRDMVITGTQKALLEKVNLVYIPVLNVQGYIRQNPSGRINQHGPNTSGRRPNGHWYNINRDFGKLDSPEARAVVKVFTDYSPHFYIDAHSTNGMNYQYDATWCGNGNAGLSPRIYDWLESEMTDDLSAFIAEQGHIPGPCIDANNPMSPEEGYYPYFSDGAAYSINNADHRQIPAYLLEIHSLKPNKQRVLGAYVFFVGVMDISGSKKDSLVAAIAADKTARVDPVPIAWDYDNPSPMVDFLGMEYSTTINEELGIEQMIWTDVSKTYNVEMSVRSTPFNPPKRPKAYYIPGVWSEVIDRLKMHGIPVETLTEEVTVDVIRYRVDDFSVGKPNREGRQTASGTPVPELHTMTYSPGDVRVDVDNPLGTLAVALLDPSGESSFFYWGFFNAKMVSHEYGSNYIVVPMAERMLSASPEIAAEWLSYTEENPDYADDPDAVVDWFFKRTTFYDSEAFLLPVGIEETSLPLNAISPPEYFEFSQKELKEMLPPQPEWTGESIKFAVDSDSMWATPAEVSDFNETATYAQVSQYASRLADAAPDKVKLISLYTYPNYEDLWMLIISESEDKSPEGLKASGKPTIFIDSGIHPGESSGVNAGLMLVRDMVITGTQKTLLEKVNLVYIPVLNVQGYIRQNPSGRINQHGPNTSGRRPNGHWYNINRDFGKLDSPEARAVVKVFTDYSPHFYIDAHSTNGMNYQYDVTWCGNGNAGLSPRIYDWLESEMTGDLSAFIAEQGHIPGPCIDANNPMSPEEGYYPYFSDGAAYAVNNADHRQIPAYLLEIHSLKPNKQRVLGAYVFFVGVMDISGSKKDSLVTAIAADKTARLDPVPIAWDYDNPSPMVDFLGMEYSTTINEELGIEQMIWTDFPRHIMWKCLFGLLLSTHLNVLRHII